MADYVLSNKADSDLGDIYEFSYHRFGRDQADAYFTELSQCLRTLATIPGMGRAAKIALPGLLRHEHGEHIIFYLPEEQGIFVIRILHRRMDVREALALT